MRSTKDFLITQIFHWRSRRGEEYTTKENERLRRLTVDELDKILFEEATK